MNSYTKRGGATRRRFCVICKKPEGGGAEINPPPRCARDNAGFSLRLNHGIIWRSPRTEQVPETVDNEPTIIPSKTDVAVSDLVVLWLCNTIWSL